jgi:putative PIG3 family NAD(P)H quinone oxidoreductase
VKILRAVRAGAGYEARLDEAPIPVPAADEVLVRVAASGVNRADLSQIAGRYPAPPGEPEGLGLEICGTVEGTGERVCALLAGGGHAEYAAVPRGQMFPAPSPLDDASAAGIPEVFLTAYLNLVLEAGIAAGGRALVHAGASGVGLAAIRTARLRGASVAATTRTAAKVPALERAGADPAIDVRREKFADAVERAWGEDAVDVVLDPVGADTFDGDLRVLAAGGRIVFLATMSGSRTELDIGKLMRKRARVIGSTLRSRSRAEKASVVARFSREVLPAFDDGTLPVDVDRVFPAARAAEAFDRMRKNENTGKIVIDWTGGA